MPLPAGDIEIRRSLRVQLRREFVHEDDTVILEEFRVRGARADVAAVNGALHGYEIKSERDTLDRLERQIPAYGEVFDVMTIVAAPKHLAKLDVLAPSWWGITVARVRRQRLGLEPVRPCLRNPAPSAAGLARLLWRHEALDILRRHSMAAGLGRAPAAQILERLAGSLSIETLARDVREAIKARARPPVPLIPSDGSCPIPATAEDRRRNFEWLLSLQFPHRPR